MIFPNIELSFNCIFRFKNNEIFQVFRKLHEKRKEINLHAKFRDVSRTQSNIYDGAFFAKMVNGLKPLHISAKKAIVDARLCSKYVSEILATINH